ncbi:hypothetical protein [Salinigranum sp. GCM10025319]|uniref:hypothetical protein n=1 Tax=Salinigranum sp. GCM10025319 TaxID=3252687 RepID=UPI0036074962
MAFSGASGSSALVGVVVALLTVWFLWDLFFAGVDLLALGTGIARPIAAVLLLSSVLYSAYRYRRYRRRGY